MNERAELRDNYSMYNLLTVPIRVLIEGTKVFCESLDSGRDPADEYASSKRVNGERLNPRYITYIY